MLIMKKNKGKTRALGPDDNIVRRVYDFSKAIRGAIRERSQRCSSRPGCRKNISGHSGSQRGVTHDRPPDAVGIATAVPQAHSLKRKGKKTLTLISWSQVLQRQASNLYRARDLLLPRLISGEIPTTEDGGHAKRFND